MSFVQYVDIELIVVKLPEAKKGFVLLPRRWVVERSFAWTSRFRRLARDFERLPETFRSLHFLAFATLMLQAFVKTIAHVLSKCITGSRNSRDHIEFLVAFSAAVGGK